MPVRSNLPDVVIPEQSLSDFMLERLRQYGNDVALIDSSLGGKSVTYKEVHDRIRACGGYLYKQGLTKGDRVGMYSPTCIEFPIAMFGIMATGAVVTLCHHAFTKGEILRQFGQTGPKMIFVHEDSVEVMKEVAEKLPCIKKIFIIGKSDEFPTWEAITSPDNEKDFPHDITFNPGEDLSILPHSSGTTGMPKSVMHTHKSMVATAIIMEKVVNFHRDVCFYHDRPMFYVTGFVNTIVALAGGAKLVIENEFQVEKMLAAIAKYRVTQAFATPAMMIEISNFENFNKYDTSALKILQCGGAVLSPTIMRTLKRRYDVLMLPGYGMTEFFVITCNNDAERFHNSVGSVTPNAEVKIVDLKTRREVGVNEGGEILATGPQLMKGYLKNPEATKQTINEEGWIHTGDFGHFDEHGMLYITDRLKELIKYKNAQVSPAELESVILKHSKVADVGVIGIPDPLTGEVPKAFVVKKDSSLTQEEIIDLVKDELSDAKQLRGGIEFIKKVPKSCFGKIQRDELKKMAAQ